MNITERIQLAAQYGCPILTYATSDPAAATEGFKAALDNYAVLTWDLASGINVAHYGNDERREYAEQQVRRLLAEAECDDPRDLVNLTETLNALGRITERDTATNTLLVVFNAQHHVAKPAEAQAVWNLRDLLKATNDMIVLVGPEVTVPAELTHDIIEIDEPLPSTEELREIVRELVEGHDVPHEADDLERAAQACTGLSAFAAEQLASLALTKRGIDIQSIWEGKYNKINATPGLQVIHGGTYADVAGCDGIKRFLGGIMGGRQAPNCVVFVDEIEKAIGGSTGDTSGVSQDQLGHTLEWMQDKKASGLIMVGPPGAAKSAIAKATGGEYKIPTIKLDLGGMKGSLVGQSEGRIRQALKVIDAMSGGRTIWLATCNSHTSLPPELRRRFKFGTWFNDIPSRDERAKIAELYQDKYGVNVPKSVLDLELTGAEIESACEIAWRMEVPVSEAIDYIVPVARAVPKTIEALREQASGRMISAASGKVYEKTGTKSRGGRRKVDLK